MPGGCAIGSRPVNLHLRGLKAMGAEIELDSGNIVAIARELTGAEIFLGGPFGSTVLGTDNVMMAAVLAKGQTIIESAACEPEVADLADFLNKMGARIAGAGTPRLVIERRRAADRLRAHGHPRPHRGGHVHDRGGRHQRRGARGQHAAMDHMMAVVDKLREIGIDVQKSNGGVNVASARRLEPTDVTTQPYPGFPTDLQAQLLTLLCLADGNSAITEKIFPDRFMHVAELLRMGADIRKEGPTAIVTGVKKLVGARRDGQRPAGLGRPGRRRPGRQGPDHDPARLPHRPRIRGHRRQTPPARRGHCPRHGVTRN